MRGGVSLCFSAPAGSSGSTSVYCQPTRAHRARAPTGIFRRHLRCSAPRTAPLIHESVHPCTTSMMRTPFGRESWLLRQDAAQTGPPVARRGCAGSVRRRPRTMRGRSLNVHGRTSSEPRRTLAKSEGRMPGDRATGGGLLFGYFLLATQEKVTRSPKGRVEALLFKKNNEQDQDGLHATPVACPSGHDQPLLKAPARMVAPASCHPSQACAGMTSIVTWGTPLSRGSDNHKRVSAAVSVPLRRQPSPESEHCTVRHSRPAP